MKKFYNRSTDQQPTAELGDCHFTQNNNGMSKSLSQKNRLIIGLIALSLCLPFSAFAFPFWQITLTKSGGECSNAEFQVYSSFARSYPDPNSYIDLVIQWKVVGQSTWITQPVPNLPQGLIDGLIYDFVVDPTSPPNPYSPPVSIEYRVVATLNTPTGGFDMVSDQSHIIHFYTLSAQGVPVINNASVNPNSGYLELSNCFPQTHLFELNTTNVDLGSVEIMIFESNSDGDNLGNPIFLPWPDSWTRPVGGPGIPQLDFLDFQTEFNNQVWFQFLTNNLGYFLVYIHYADRCETMSRTEIIHIRINTTPAVVDFEFQMDDPSSPLVPIPIFFQPSQDINNPVEVGSGSGRLNMASTNPYYDLFEMVISKQNGPDFDPVGGFIENSPSYSALQINPYSATFYNDSLDNPTNNLDVMYKIEIILSSPNCPPASLMSYFRLPPSLLNQRVEQGLNSELNSNHWHTQQSGSQAFNMNIESSIESKLSQTYTLRMIAVDGRTVFNKNDLRVGENLIEVANLRTGVYIIQTYDDQNNLIYTGKVVF